MWNIQFAGGHQGDYLGASEASDWSTAVSLNAGEGGTAKFPVDSFDSSPARLQWLTEPRRRWVVVCWNNTPMSAGLITKRRYDSKDRQLELVLEDLWSLLKRRYMIAPSAKPAESVQKFGPASMSTMAVRVVQFAAERPEALARLPIDYPSLVPGTVELSYYGYNGSNVGDALEDIMRWEGGPEIYFEPYWAGDFLRFRMHSAEKVNIGRVLDLNLDAGDVVTSVQQEEDAANLVTRAYVFGEGAGKATKAIAVHDSDQQYMTVEAVYPDKRTNRIQPLESFGRRMLSRFRNPVTATTMTVQAGDKLQPDWLVPGMTINLHAKADPWLPDSQTFRLAGYALRASHSGGQIDIDLQR